jgi:hypothetical protein
MTSGGRGTSGFGGCSIMIGKSATALPPKLEELWPDHAGHRAGI